MNKKIKWLLILLVAAAVAGFIFMKTRPKKDLGESITEINPAFGSVQAVISTTGTVLPKNRLEIKPPVNGRVESVLVVEGQDVKAGEILAWMSSTERAALLDAARSQGPEKLKYWQEVYKPIELLAPIDAEVIVATTQPGQTVTTADAVVVLSDNLIVRAQVDETDIGRIRLAQKANITLDAYPDVKIKAAVEHIYYESKTVNNVTIYEVDLVPEEIPEFFRSGMNATIDFLENSKENTMFIPAEALHTQKDEKYVLLKINGSPEPARRVVRVGLSNDKEVEILSGLDAKDIIIIKSKKYSLPTSELSSSPLVPFRGKKQASSR